MSTIFKVKLPVKSYVWRYLMMHCEDKKWPRVITFKHDALLNRVWKQVLHKDYQFKKGGYPENMKHYKKEVEIIISEDDFNRYGWAVSSEDAVYLGRLIEKMAKDELYHYLNMYVAFGISVTVAIARFRKNYGYTEDEWPDDSIRKEYMRRKSPAKELAKEIMDKLDLLFVDRFSKNKTS